MFLGVPIKPLLFCGGRGEGREKQGQKMKKLFNYSTPSLPRSRKNFSNIQRKQIFCKKTPFYWTEKRKSSLSLSNKHKYTAVLLPAP